eukprot:gene16100-22242_t
MKPAESLGNSYTESELRFWERKAAFARSFAASGRAPRVIEEQPSKILDNMFLSGQGVERDRQVLDKYGITAILQVGLELKPSHLHRYVYKHIPVVDLEEEDLVSFFEECINFIHEGRQKGAVLVHCAAGISRSASICIAYIMKMQSASLSDARATVKAARPQVNPNMGFSIQMQLFEQSELSYGCLGCEPWTLHRFLTSRKTAGGSMPGGNVVLQNIDS